jgi:DNA recombination protein RmuC
MEMIIIAAAAAAIAALGAWLVTRSFFLSKIQGQEQMHLREMANAEKLAQQAKEGYEKALDEMKKTITATMEAQTQKLLREREEELRKGNQSSMEDILKPLKESIRSMQDAMKDNEKSHVETTAKLSKQLEQAVKDMTERTSDVGRKADTLSEALTGRPKVQGCFGENFLNDILVREGLKEGEQYTREEANADRSRPDFVFHFKDGLEEKDLIVDSKVSLTAYVEFMNADSEEERSAALDRHVKSVRKHIDELAAKDYARKTSRSFADYVLMFMPMEMAYRTALAADHMLWQDAYKKNVLIVTEQTIIPFLKIMHLTWNKYRHDTRIQEITAAAQMMMDRVADFYAHYIDLGKRLSDAGKAYNAGVGKLREGGHSITTSAKKVIELGGKLSKGKTLAEPDQIAEIENVK